MPIHIERTVNDIFPLEQAESNAAEPGDTRWQQQELWRAQMQREQRQQARTSAADFED